MKNYLTPNWPASTHVKAFTSLRQGGHSKAPYQSFNLSTNVADNPSSVALNRQQLRAELNLPQEPNWIMQVHGTQVVRADKMAQPTVADAAYTDVPSVVCVVLTADCLPILLCDHLGRQVAAIHAGWRGLLAGIIEKTIEHMNKSGSDLIAWLGPAIGPKAYEVGDEVRAEFTKTDPQAHLAFNKAMAPGKWLADLYLLARQRLKRLGVIGIYGGQFCTFTESSQFYSFRRDQGKTGRMASLIWLG